MVLAWIGILLFAIVPIILPTTAKLPFFEGRRRRGGRQQADQGLERKGGARHAERRKTRSGASECTFAADARPHRNADARN